MRARTLLPALLLAPALAAQDMREIRGVVVDEQERPLAGVAVCPFPISLPFTTAELAAHAATRTGADGRFALQIAVQQRPPYDTALFVAEGRVHVAAGLAYLDMLPVVLPRGRTLAGTVRDGAGRPLAGVRVEARDWLAQSGFFGPGPGPWSGPPEPRTAVRTDGSGRFVLAGTCDTSICLRVGGDGFTISTHGPLAAGQSWDAVIERAPVVTVQVVDAAGAPLPGVHLWSASDQTTTEHPDGYSDAAGRWQFTWFGTGPILIQAQDADYRAIGRVKLEHPVEQVRLETRPPEQAPAAQPIAAAGTIAVRGRVLDGDRPVAGAFVRVVRPGRAEQVDGYVLDGRARDSSAVRTGADGTFELRVAPGKHLLVAAADNSGRNWRMPGRERNPTPLPVDVLEGREAGPFDLRLQPLVGVRGKIDAARLPRGCMVRFVPFRPGHSGGVEDFDFEPRFPLAADGSFAADGLQARRYHAQLLLPRGFRQGLPDKVLLDVVDVAAGADLRVAAPKALPATVRGSVRSNAPTTRLAVLSLPANDDRLGSLFSGVHYWGPVCPVARDGSYLLREPPGDRALLVVDLWSGVVLAREALSAVAPGSDRQQDLKADALPLDVEARGVPAGARPWLDLVVSAANWPAGLGNMVELVADQNHSGLGVALQPAPEVARLWLPAGETRLVLRVQRGVRGDGKDVLADVTIDPRREQHVVLDAAPGDVGAKK